MKVIVVAREFSLARFVSFAWSLFPAEAFRQTSISSVISLSIFSRFPMVVCSLRFLACFWPESV